MLLPAINGGAEGNFQMCVVSLSSINYRYPATSNFLWFCTYIGERLSIYHSFFFLICHFRFKQQREMPHSSFKKIYVSIMYMMSIRYLLSRQVVRGAIAFSEPTVRPARRTYGRTTAEVASRLKIMEKKVDE